MANISIRDLCGSLLRLQRLATNASFGSLIAHAKDCLTKRGKRPDRNRKN